MYINQVMAVLEPLKVVLTNAPTNGCYEVADFPFDPARGSHKVMLNESEIYIDRSDFRMVDDDDYYGLAPGKVVGLKYAMW